MAEPLIMSTLRKTCIFDLDSTLVQHTGYRTPERDCLLPGVKEYLDNLSAEDYTLILTAWIEEFQAQTLSFLKESGLRYDNILFGMSQREHILVNDRKPSGIDMARSVNMDRDRFVVPEIICNR